MSYLLCHNHKISCDAYDFYFQIAVNFPVVLTNVKSQSEAFVTHIKCGWTFSHIYPNLYKNNLLCLLFPNLRGHLDSHLSMVDRFRTTVASSFGHRCSFSVRLGSHHFSKTNRLYVCVPARRFFFSKWPRTEWSCERALSETLTSTKPLELLGGRLQARAEDSPIDSSPFQVKNAKEEPEQFSTSLKMPEMFSLELLLQRRSLLPACCFFPSHLCNKKEIR